MFEKVIDQKTRNVLLKIIGGWSFTSSWYLGGGTALALQIGHRKSQDLDFFSREKFDGEILLSEIGKTARLKVELLKEDTIVAYMNGVRFSLFYYPYRLIAGLKSWSGINLSDVRDIAAMKLVAISQRGVKRDFVDLYFICKSGYTLEEILGFYKKKYGKFAQNVYSVLKSLVFFEDAED